MIAQLALDAAGAKIRVHVLSIVATGGRPAALGAVRPQVCAAESPGDGRGIWPGHRSQQRASLSVCALER